MASLTSRVLAEPSGCLPRRPSTSAGRTGTPLPSNPRYIVGAGLGTVSATARSSAATSRPRASAQRSTCLVSTRTAASSHNRSLAAAKLKSEAASPTIRSTPGDSDVACIPRARSRGHTPVRQASQW